MSAGAQFKDRIYNDEHCRRLYYKLLCLPLLPQQHILEQFETIEKDGRSLESPLMNKFLKYYRRQWIERVKCYTFFIVLASIKFKHCLTSSCYDFQEGPAKISVFDLKHRTTSAVEGYNSALGAALKKHDNYFNFATGILQDEQKKAYEVSVLIDSGGFSANKKKSRVKARY